MTLTDAAVYKPDLVDAALKAIRSTLQERGLDLELESDWRLYAALYDEMALIQVREPQ
jgi:hypothetical protein